MSSKNKFRGKLDERLVSKGAMIVTQFQDDDQMGLVAQGVAKAALAFAVAATNLKDACLIACIAPSDQAISGEDRRRVESVYSGLASQIEEIFGPESELEQTLEMMVVMGMLMTPDPDQQRVIEAMAAGLGISTAGLSATADDADEDGKPHRTRRRS